MSMNDYKENADLLGAYDRYEKTSRQWKNRWWAVVEEIYNASAEWAKKYILNPVKRTLTAIIKKRGRPAKYNENDFLTFECEASGCGAYFVEHYDGKRKKWSKCGKADNAHRRLKQHFTVDYKGEITRGIVKLWYPCVNSDHALTMENVMRDYFHHKKNLRLLGNDRFPDCGELTAEDVEYLNRKYALTKALFE